jgi:hypothetical protein
MDTPKHEVAIRTRHCSPFTVHWAHYCGHCHPIYANQKMSAPVPQPEAVSTSAPIAASAVAETTAQVATPTLTTPVTTTPLVITATPTVNTALPTDTATAAEELDRLKDEQTRLKERKKDLTKQLAISKNLLALKEQQLKELGQINP